MLTLVDARHVVAHLDEVKPDGAVNEAVTQVAFADKILLNKTDLVSASELKEVRSRIKALNGAAEIIACQLRPQAGQARAFFLSQLVILVPIPPLHGGKQKEAYPRNRSPSHNPKLP